MILGISLGNIPIHFCGKCQFGKWGKILHKMHKIERYGNFGLSYYIHYVKVLPETLQFDLLVYTD